MPADAFQDINFQCRVQDKFKQHGVANFLTNEALSAANERWSKSFVSKIISSCFCSSNVLSYLLAVKLEMCTSANSILLCSNWRSWVLCSWTTRSTSRQPSFLSVVSLHPNFSQQLSTLPARVTMVCERHSKKSCLNATKCYTTRLVSVMPKLALSRFAVLKPRSQESQRRLLQLSLQLLSILQKQQPSIWRSSQRMMIASSTLRTTVSSRGSIILSVPYWNLMMDCCWTWACWHMRRVSMMASSCMVLTCHGHLEQLYHDIFACYLQNPSTEPGISENLWETGL